MIAISLLMSSSLLFASQRAPYTPSVRNKNIVFVLPCEGEIKISNSAMIEFQDDWGKNDSAIKLFKKNLISSLEQKIHNEFPIVDIANSKTFCSEANGKIRSEFIQDESIIDENLVDERYVAITRRLPSSIDTSKAVYVILQNIEYYVNVVSYKGRQVMGFANGNPQFSYTKDSNSNRLALKYEFIIISPMQDRYIFANRYSAMSYWGFGSKTWITQWNWKSIESKMVNNIIEHMRKNIAFKGVSKIDSVE